MPLMPSQSHSSPPLSKIKRVFALLALLLGVAGAAQAQDRTSTFGLSPGYGRDRLPNNNQYTLVGGLAGHRRNIADSSFAHLSNQSTYEKNFFYPRPSGRL